MIAERILGSTIGQEQPTSGDVAPCRADLGAARRRDGAARSCRVGKTDLLQSIARRLDAIGASHASQIATEEQGDGHRWLLLDEPGVVGAANLRQALDQAERGRYGIAIATRQLDSLPLARLRAEGCVILLGPAQIGMVRTDRDALLRTALPRRTADWLADLCGNWSVAIRLLADHARRPDARFDLEGDFLGACGLAAYIDQEILADLPTDWTGALTFAAIVTCCDRAMLDAIRPDGDLGRHLALLRERLPGLVNYQDGQTMLHPLLRLHLNRRFEQLPRTMRVDALERAATRCTQVGRTAEAVGLVARIGAPAAIGDFIRRSDGLQLWVSAGFDVIRTIVDKADPIEQETDPKLALFRCLVLQKEGRIAEAERLFDAIAPTLAQDDAYRRDLDIVRATLQIYGCRPPRQDEKTGLSDDLLQERSDPALRMFFHTIRCILAIQRGDLDQGTAAILEAAKQDEGARSDYALMFLDIHQANIALARADLKDARMGIGRARKAQRDSFATDRGLDTILEAVTASLEFEAGRLSSARHHIRRATQNMPHVEAWLDIYVAAYEPMARLMALDVGLGATVANLQAQQSALVASGLPRIARIVKALELCLKGEAALAEQSGTAIERLAQARDERLLSWQERELFTLADAYADLAVGEYGAAGNGLAALLRFAEPRGLLRTVLRARLLLVAVLDARGDVRGADDLFDQALALGVATGCSRAFAEIGGAAVSRRWRAEIAAIRPNAAMAPDRLRLLRQLARWQSNEPAMAPAKLTMRERDVLAALDQGGGDKTIGRRLGVTEHAVRYHLKNIYRKLGANDRIGALSQARANGMLQ